MKPSVTSYCKYDNVGLAFIFLLAYGPAILVGIITFVSFVTILIVMCRRALQQEQGLRQPSVHQQGLKEVLPLLLYPLIYFLLWMGLVVTRIYDAAQGRKFQYSLILIHDIISGIIILLLTTAVLLHSSLNCYKRHRKRTHTLNTTTSYVVPNESSDQDKPLIIKEPHAAGPAVVLRPLRSKNARPSSPWHDDLVRGAGRGDRQSHRQAASTSSSQGVFGVSERH